MYFCLHFFKMSLSFWLLFVLAQHSVTGLNVCREAELQIIITVDCNYPPNHWDMIMNLLEIVDARATGQPLTMMIDLSSWSNVTLNKSSVENVYKMCTNLNKSEERLSNTNILKLQELMKTNNTTKHLYINILQDSKYSTWASLIENIQFKSYNMLNIIISKTDQIQSFQTKKSIFIAKHDNLKNNNLISYLLCQKCKKDWYPKIVNGTIRSCFLFEKKEEPVTWPHAARYCTMKNSHLITFETFLDYTLTQNIMQKIINKISTPKNNKSLINIFIGLHTQLSNQLLWVNNRPVPYFIHDIINSSYFITDICFHWRIYKSIDRSKILGSKCVFTKNRYSLCQQDLVLEVENITMSELLLSSDKSLTNCYPNMTESHSTKCSLDSQTPKFHCSNSNSFVSFHQVCDGVMDCSGGEDEDVCTFDGKLLKKCIRNNQFVCSSPQANGLQCLTRSKVCNKIHDCPDDSDEAHCSPCTEHSCSPHVCIPRHWVFSCDLVNSKDFFSYRSQTSLDKSLEIKKKIENIVFCRKYNKTKKYEHIQTHTNTYNRNWAPRCIHMKSTFGIYLGCDDLEHLSDCRQFVCPSGFTKCFKSYCLPDTYVNDGVEDCPYGEDEGYLAMFLIKYNYFFCRSSSRRIDKIYVCDGTKDCPKGDDEHDCDDQCPEGFICSDGTVTVQDKSARLNLSSLSNNVLFLNISELNLTETETSFHFPNLLVLIASESRLKDASKVTIQSQRLYELDLSHNELFMLKEGDWMHKFRNLRTLNLSYNTELQSVSPTYFHVFKQLVSLDLSSTQISDIHLNENDQLIFLNLSKTNLKSLQLSPKAQYQTIDISQTKILDTSAIASIEHISSKITFFADFNLCCYFSKTETLQGHNCINRDMTPLSSCDSLLGDPLKKVLLWIVGCVAFIGNLVSLIYTFVFDRIHLKNNFISFVVCLNISDLIMGIYLLIIASVDVSHGNNYYKFDSLWRDSNLCQLAGMLITLSVQTSTFLITLITLERIINLKFPHGEYKISSKVKYLLIGLSWGLGFLLSVIPIMIPEMKLYSSNSMCVGFPLKKFIGAKWAYSLSVYLVLNSVLFVIITYGQFVILRSILLHNARRSSVIRSSNIALASRILLVVLSNLACWFPVCIIGLMTVFTNYEVTRETYSWIVTLALPVNSALNPLLYTAPRIHRSWTVNRQRRNLQVEIPLRQIN